jgi:hypothetical protein
MLLLPPVHVLELTLEDVEALPVLDIFGFFSMLYSHVQIQVEIWKLWCQIIVDL